MKRFILILASVITATAICYGAGDWGRSGSNPKRGNYHPDGTTITATENGTMSAASGILAITDSTSTTSSTTAASATAMKSAYDLANAAATKAVFGGYSSRTNAALTLKVDSVSGEGAILSSGGVTPIISLSSIPFANLSAALRGAGLITE